MTDHLTVNGDGKLQFSAAVKWLSAVTGTLFTLALAGLVATVLSDSRTLGRIDERLVALEARLVRLEAAVVAGTADRYTGTDAARDQAAIDRRLSALERRLYEGRP